MNITTVLKMHHRSGFSPVVLGVVALLVSSGGALAADQLPNACPVDGCDVKIIAVKSSGEQLELTFEANFSPDLSKNHIHVWWGEQYNAKQVSRNAEPVHGVTQGKWHLTDDFPTYVTQGAVAIEARSGAKTLCVSAADRDHNIIDVNAFHCMDVSQHL